MKFFSARTSPLHHRISKKNKTFPRRTILSLSLLSWLSTWLSSCATNFSGIRQWFHAYAEPGVHHALLSVASEYSTIPVKIEWIAGDYDRKASIALISPHTPDVLELGGGVGIDVIQAHEIIPVTDLFSHTITDFLPEILKEVTWKGNIYGIPQVIDSQLLFYRPSILQAHGLEAPTTLEELLSTAKAISTEDTKGLFLGNNLGSQLVSSIIYSTGTDIMSNNRAQIASPAVAEVLNTMHELAYSGALLIGSPTDWSDPAALTTGLCAMQICGSWAIPYMEQILGDDIGAIAWPKAQSTLGVPVVPIGAYVSVVPAHSSKISQARSYIRWLWIDNVDFQLRFAQEYGLHIPARHSLLAHAEQWRKTALRIHVLELVQQYGKLAHEILFTPVITQALSDMYSRIVREGKDVMTELNRTTTIINTELLHYTS